MAEDADKLVEVSPEMAKAGMIELGEHRLGDDLRQLAAEVYRAMEYERRDALKKAGGLRFDSHEDALAHARKLLQESKDRFAAGDYRRNSRDCGVNGRPR